MLQNQCHTYGIDQFKVVERIGEGFFNEVFKVKPLECDGHLPKCLVMKVGKVITNSSKKNARISARKAAEREANLLSKLKHPNILRFRGMVVERAASHWSINLLVDYCDRGSLQQLIISKKKNFSWKQQRIIAHQLCNAMRYVNSAGYMHRDLTAMNVLLQSQKGQKYPKVILADFGLSSVIPKPSDSPEQVGSDDYMSPEMLLEKPYNEKSDVFSFGIILCQQIARIHAEHISELYRTNDFGISFEDFAKICPRDTPKDLFCLAVDCCKYESSDRPSFQTLYDRLTNSNNNNNDSEASSTSIYSFFC